MRRFTMDQMLAAFEVEQMLCDMAAEIDLNEARNVGQYYAEDGIFINVEGREAIQAFYDKRGENVKKYQRDGQRTGRHLFGNLRVVFEGDGADRAAIHCTSINFFGEGKAPVQGVVTPASIADVIIECRRGEEGDWLFTRFTPNQAFLGEDDFMKLMLSLNAKQSG